MTEFFCVNVGTKYSDDYVRKLQSMLRRHVKQPHTLTCITDHVIDGVNCLEVLPGLPGWWAKVQLFSLRKPLVYFDLDVVVTADLSPLIEWKGFGIIELATDRAVAYGGNAAGVCVTPVFNSSVMKLSGENEYHVFEQFKPVVMERFKKGGDQRWITARMLSTATTFPMEWFPSYKWGNDGEPYTDHYPTDALAVVFHGYPKPHEFLTGWVADEWR